MKYSLHLLFISTILAACSGEDRSGEQPFPPTVAGVGCTVEGNIATLKACVTSSPNSSLKQCGFYYGNDTLRLEAKAAEPAVEFSAQTRELEAGRYFAIPYAQNGVGTTKADTMWFEIPAN